MKLRDFSATTAAMLLSIGCGSTTGDTLFAPHGSVQSYGGSSASATGGVTYVLPGSGGDPNFDTGGDTGQGGHIGQGGDTGQGGVTTTDASPPDSGGAMNPTGCDYSGTWATYITVPVSWPDAPLVLIGGQGTLQQWDLSHQQQDGFNVKAQTVPCGIFLPDLKSGPLGGNASYGIRFPNTLFDDGDIPWVPFVMKGAITLNGIGFTTDPFAILLGLDLPDAVHATWPKVGTMKLVDDDLDGKPGVTVVPATGSGYSFPPTDLAGAHADLIYIGERTVSTLQGNFNSCDQVSGSVTLLSFTGGTGIDSTVVGCRKTDGTECVSSDASFVDSIRPVYSPTGAGTFTSVRLVKSATCPDVRARFPIAH